MSYREFGDKVDLLASGLQSLGVEPGDRVANVLSNGATYPWVIHAVIKMGGVSVGVNPTLRSSEFLHILNDSEAVAVIVAEKFFNINPLKKIREMRSELPHLRHIIVVGDAVGDEVNLQELMDGAEIKDAYHQADSNDLAALIYTSGTTGLPKGSMHSHYTLLYPLMADPLKTPTPIQILKIIGRYGLGYFIRLIKAFGQPLKVYYSMPPYSGAGVIGAINLFLSGRTAVHLSRFIPVEVLKLIEKEKVHVLGLPPSLATLLVRSRDIKKYDLRSLMYFTLGQAPVPPSLVDEVMEVVGCPVMIGFGATELVGAPVATNPFADPKWALRETVGKVADSYKYKIVDEERQLVPTGVVGELALMEGARMLGYYRADELTNSAFDEEG
jgi:acyl-CoA synthetase (AMP-forming)/AMP-acid ligase II